MSFWKLCYDRNIIDIDYLKQVVITATNIYGELTTEQFKEITGIEYSV